MSSTNNGGRSAPSELEITQQVLRRIGQSSIINAGGELYTWDGRGLWRRSDKQHLKQVVQNTIPQCFPKFNVRAATVKNVAEMIMNQVFTPSMAFNKGPKNMVNFRNTCVQLDDGKWIKVPHDPNHYSTIQIPHNFSETAIAPRFEQFLQEIFAGDDDFAEKRQCLLEMIGYSLANHCDLEVFIMLIGAGANGKSVVLKLLNHLLGSQNCSAVQPKYFGSTFQRAHMTDKLANIVTEIDQGQTLPDGELKALTSGEAMTVERKHQAPFEMTPYATQWFGTNHLPSTTDFSNGIYRRAILMHFNNTFSASSGGDPDLLSKLKKEAEGIIAMAIHAYADLAKRGYSITIPESSLTAIEQWKINNDPVHEFINQACLKDSKASIGATELFQKYVDWTSVNGLSTPGTQKHFGQRLRNLNIPFTRSANGIIYRGITA